MLVKSCALLYAARSPTLVVVEREIYAQAIKQAGGNLTRAAKWLGVTRLTMREKLNAFGLRSEPDVE